jgi:cytochrome c oxidase subunit II
MNKKRIFFHAVLLVASTGVFLQQMAIRSSAEEVRNTEQVIRISATTFEFKPSEITLRKGIPVTLELISQDRHHGFNLAQFHVRAQIQPGVIEKVRFVPDKVGHFTFFCDVFCGDGHEEMSGTIRVIEP